MKLPGLRPKPQQISQTSSDSAERKTLIRRLQALKGSRYTSPRGVKGILCQDGIHCPEKNTLVPYEACGDHPGMTLDQLREVTRDNEAHLEIPSDQPMTKAEGQELLEKIQGEGKDRKLKIACGLYGKYFSRRCGKITNIVDEVPVEPFSQPPNLDEVPF